MMQIEIDSHSGFCFGVTTAIRRAEQSLAMADASGPLYCLGDIVHNRLECERLHALGLHTIGHAEFARLPRGSRVLLRAHGEPPATYEQARLRGIELIDATCPVVLQLQRRVRQAWMQAQHTDEQIVIYGKPGHAEVLGLVGQTEGHAVVVSSTDDAARLGLGSRSIRLFSQTTQPLEGFRSLQAWLESHMTPGCTLQCADTICRQVSGRLASAEAFAREHDVVVFVCGLKSSNGRVLFEACRRVNPRSYLTEGPLGLQPEWFSPQPARVGICGATSTPAWLMQACARAIRVIEQQGQ